MKKWIAALLLLCMALCFAACNNETGNPTVPPTDAPTNPSEPTTPPTTQGGPKYVVTVVDTEGKPLAGAWVMICKLGEGGLCTPAPAAAGADGVTIFDKAEDEYKVSFIQLPEGYTYVDEAVQEFYFESGSKELTIVLKKA